MFWPDWVPSQPLIEVLIWLCNVKLTLIHEKNTFSFQSQKLSEHNRSDIFRPGPGTNVSSSLTIAHPTIFSSLQKNPPYCLYLLTKISMKTLLKVLISLCIHIFLDNYNSCDLTYVQVHPTNKFATHAIKLLKHLFNVNVICM